MMNGFRTARGWMVCLCAAAAATAACSRGASAPAESSAVASAQVGANGEKYPAPRWPSYFKTPKSVDDLMPAARLLVRNQSGLQGKGMGILQPGEKVLIVAADEADPMVIEAITKALEERKITPYVKFTYEMRGTTKEQAAARSRAPHGRTGHQERRHLPGDRVDYGPVPQSVAARRPG